MARKRKTSIGSILFIVVILGFFFYGITGGFGIKGNNRDNYETKVWVIAKNEVETRLKSPKSAKFPSLKGGDVDISKKGDRYIIKSYVDADNSFGASTRSNFSVTVSKSSNGNYIVESVYIK